MKFTPTKYAVIYHNERHPVGVTFEIAPEDAEEMSVHGTVEQKPATGGAETRRTAGRRKKN